MGEFWVGRMLKPALENPGRSGVQQRNAQTKISERFTCRPQNFQLLRIIVITWQSDMGCLETPATRSPVQHQPNEGHTGHTAQGRTKRRQNTQG